MSEITRNIVLTAESGSDISPALAERYGIYIVPMHVSFGAETRDDGSFPPDEICAYYDRTGHLPKTAGSSPEDFTKAFDDIRSKWPNAGILHLAYSAVTTVSYQSAVIASEGRENIVCLDTKHVSAGQCAIVIALAKYLEKHPETTLDQAAAKAKELMGKARMCFIPDDLEYLRAGGRISNVVYFLGGRLLHFHPRVEVLDGKLVATKKYRGSMEKAVASLIKDYTAENHLSKDHLWLLHTVRYSESMIETAENAARECGYHNITWIQAQGVITTHGGPNAIAVAGFSED